MSGPREIGKPEPGFFKTRLVRNGPWLGAIIYLPCPMVPYDFNIAPEDWCQPYDRSRRLQAEIDGKPCDIWRVWTGGKPISEDEYLYLRDLRDWAKRHAPDDAYANPMKPVSLREMEPIF